MGTFVKRLLQPIAALHRCDRTRKMTSLSAGEAGKRAEAIANNTDGLKENRHVESMSTLLAHAGVDSSIPNTPMSPPIHTATTYTRPSNGNYLETDSIYTRTDNPTRLLLEKTVGELDCHGAEYNDGQPTTCAFSSGMMAVSSIILAHEAPLRVILPMDRYHGVPTLLSNVFHRFGVEMCLVDYDRLADVENLVKTTSKQVVVWMESPSNPLCQIIDISAVCSLVCQSPNVTTVVDTTLAPPVLAQPLRVRLIAGS
jgi:cystathionine beta-lyase/cystathionine gamma-synthase